MGDGCSTYSRPPAARSSTPIAATASSTDQAPLASIRIRPSGPSASRTASSRAWSSASVCPGSATFTLAVRQPPRATIACAASGPTAGTVTLTGTASRTGAGQSPAAASSAQRSHGSATRASYSRNGLHSPQPAGPSTSAASRTVTPRKRVRIGIETTLIAVTHAARPGAPAGRACRWAAAGSRRQPRARAAPSGRGWTSATQSRSASRRLGRGRRAASTAPGTNATTRLPHSSSGTPSTSTAATAGCSRSRAATATAGTFTPPLTTTSSTRPSTDSRPSSSIRPASEVRYQPSTRVLRGELRVVDVLLEQGRTADPDPAAVADRDGHAVEGQAVVDAAARGLRGAVRRDDADRRPRPPARRRAGSIGPPPRSTVCARRRAAVASCVVEQPAELGRHQGDEPPVARRPAVALEQHRLVPGDQRPHDRPARRRRTSAAAPAPTDPSRRAAARTPRPRRARRPG